MTASGLDSHLNPTPAAFELLGITKRFGSLVALDDVSMAVQQSSIHALLGENGAGKTTLMRVAFGLVTPDAGSITIRGELVRIGSPADAIRTGIGMVHQQFSLVPAMTAVENVALGGRGLFRRADIVRRMQEIRSRTRIYVNPGARVADLTTAERQKLEIVRNLAHDARILILDEPTAVLTPEDTGELFAQLRAFADAGGSVVLITHRLQDALAHADEVTVLRRGRVTLRSGMSGLTRDVLAEAMLGTPPADIERGSPALTSVPVAQLHEARVRWRGDIRGPFTFQARGGEIAGMAGLDAAAVPLLRLLAGRVEPLSGEVSIPAEIGFVPENRQHEALIPDFTLTENVALRDSGKRAGRLPWQTMRLRTAHILQGFAVRADGPASPARSLSGGNQQRFVLGRELSQSPPLLVFENPTHGLDIRAATVIHQAMRDAAHRGAAIVFYSSDLDELAAIADRVFVVSRSAVIPSPLDREGIGRVLLSIAT